MRLETGPVQFGNDWPGVFIRGDDAIYFAVCLEDLIERAKENNDPQLQIHIAVLKGLLSDLKSPDTRYYRDALKLRPIEECNGSE